MYKSGSRGCYRQSCNGILQKLEAGIFLVFVPIVHPTTSKDILGCCLLFSSIFTEISKQSSVSVEDLLMVL